MASGPNTGTGRTTADLLEQYADYKPAKSSNRQLMRDQISSWGVRRDVRVNVKDAPFFAKGDALLYPGAGATTSGLNTFVQGSTAFTVADVNKWVRIRGAGVAGAPLIAQIVMFVSASTVGLSVAASTTVANKPWVYGTDDTVAIQTALDYAGYTAFRQGTVELGGGTFLTLNTLHCLYGAGGFKKLAVEGEGYNYRAQNNQAGTAILPLRWDRPGINIQGGRGVELRRFSVIGALGDYYDEQQFCFNNGALIDDTLATNWDDPTMGGALLDSRYCPYAAITIDAYSGTRPGVSYPDVTYPAFLGAQSQYGKAFSSDCLLEDLFVSGFTVAFANQPCDADGNGDFTNIRRCNVEKCKWIISVGNTQSRNVAIDDLKFGIVYAAMTNSKHGKALGQFAGTVKNMSGGASIKLFELITAYCGAINFENCYAEAMWQIGFMDNNASMDARICFDGGHITFDLHGDVRGYPSWLVTTTGTGGSGSAELVFNGFGLSSHLSVAQFQLPAQSLQFNGLSTWARSTRTNPYEKFAHNATMGGVTSYQLKTPNRCRLHSNFFYNLDTGANQSLLSQYSDFWRNTSRISCIPWMSEWHGTVNGNYDKSQLHYRTATAFAKGSFLGLSLVGSTLTITFNPTRSEYSYARDGPLPGDVIWDDQTGSVFFVRSRVGDVVLAELQNNYKKVAGVVTPLAAFSTTVGNLYWRNCRIYTPIYQLRGDTTAATALVSNFQRDDGFAAWFDAEISVGDYLLLDDQNDVIMSSGASLIAARSQAAKTITFTAGVTRTVTRQQFPWFIRQPPANV